MSSLLADITETQQRFFEFARLPGRWSGALGLLVLGLLCYGVFWLYRREARAGAGARLRGVLAVLRCAALVVLAVIWLQPVLATHVIRTITAQVVVLADVSASMWIADVAAQSGDASSADAAPPITRIAGVESLLSRGGHAWLRRLAAKNELALYAFARDTDRVSLPPPLSRRRLAGQDTGGTPVPQAPPGDAAAPLLLHRPAQPATDVGQALAAALEGAGDSAIAGIVLISDGASNEGMPPDETIRYAARMKFPVHAVGVGRTSEPPNVRVARVSAPATVARGDPFQIRVELAAEAIEPTELTLELIGWPVSDDAQAGPSLASGAPPARNGATSGEPSDATTLPPGARRIATRTFTLGGGNAPEPRPDEAADPAKPRSPAPQDTGGTPVPQALASAPNGAEFTEGFEVSEEEPGDFVYRARVTELPDEVVVFDNVAETSVRVLETKLRVLVVAGGPTYDYRYVTRLFERDRTIDVSCWLQSADERAVRDGDVVITALPREPDEIFAYDVILLMDPNPRTLDSGWAVTVRRFVDEFGGGLLYQAGRYYATRFLSEPALDDLRAVLPIVTDPDASVRLSEQGSYHTRGYAAQIPDQSLAHPLLALTDDAHTSRAIWDAMPGVWWYLPVLRAKPIATVLMEHADPTQRNAYGAAILMATQPFGSGRTVFIGHDTTWRWRGPAEPHFNRFWVQMVRYLGQMRRQGAGRRGLITIDRTRVDAGAPFTIEARVLGESYAPWHEPEISATIDLPDGGQIAPTLRAVSGREGWYSGRVVVGQEGVAVIRIPLPGSKAAPETLVQRVRVHRQNVELRSLRQRVEFLKALSERTRGEYLPIERADELPDRIERATQVRTTRGPDQDLWDRWWSLAALAALLSVEWALRRRNHLL